MAVASASLRLRASTANTAANLVELFNGIHNLIIATGMVQCSSSDVTGQAGTFTEATPGSGETQIVLGTVSGYTTVGYKAYKHPTLPLYLRVTFYDFGALTTTSRYGLVAYTVATALSGGALDVAKSTPLIRPLSVMGTGSSMTTTNLSATYQEVSASCGDDHFWIGNLPWSLWSTSTAYFVHPSNGCELGIGIFKAEGVSEFLVLSTPSTQSGSGSQVLPASFNGSNSVENGSTRYWTYSAGTWSVRYSGAAGSLQDNNNPSAATGVRVQRAKLIINGIERRFNFGFINAGSIANMGVLSMNLAGTTQQYKALHGLGPAAPLFQTALLADSSVPILPWAA